MEQNLEKKKKKLVEAIQRNELKYDYVGKILMILGEASADQFEAEELLNLARIHQRLVSPFKPT